MIGSIIGFLAMLNPFALFLYLDPIRKDLSHASFRRVVLKASVISFLVCAVFFFTGNFILEKVFRINFESFRIFGGIVIFSFAYYFIVKGQKALIMMKENLDDLASEIALPFMVGAGTISLSILLSQNHSLVLGITGLFLIFAINFFFIMGLVKIRRAIDHNKFRVAFDKNLEVLLRLNGFFVGAIGVDMVLVGINNLFLL